MTALRGSSRVVSRNADCATSRNETISLVNSNLLPFISSLFQELDFRRVMP